MSNKTTLFSPFIYPELISTGKYNIIKIGDNAVVSQGSYICTGSHDISKESFDIYSQKTTTQQQAWIAASVFVGPGVTIEKGCVVGAGSSVFSDHSKDMVCIGTHAKPMYPRS